MSDPRHIRDERRTREELTGAPDELSWCEATIIAVHKDDTADVQIKATGEWNVHLSRLIPRAIS